MKITDKVFIMPRVEEKYLNRAKKTELKVLYIIFMNGGNTDVAFLCEKSQEDAESVRAALAFWRCAGILEENDGEQEEKICEKPESEVKMQSQEKKSIALPAYTLKEIAQIRERDGKFGSLVSYFEKITGHLYNSAEQGIVLYLYDTMGIDCELIMGVAQYCASLGKVSARYIEKTVLNITESGISTYAEFEEYLSRQKKSSDFAETVKKIIGASNRSLTRAETVHVSRWEKEYGCSEELISLAYEKTVAKINKPQVSYMSKILEDWHMKGLKTPEEVEKFFSCAENKAPNADKDDGRLSFNLDDIFEKP